MRQVGFNRSCFLLQLVLSWECFMSIMSSLRRLSLYLVSLSFSIHILRIESLVPFMPYESQIESISSTRPRVYGRSWACACFVSNSFDFKIASSWRRDSILRPSERMHRRKKLCILPQDHGVLADSCK